MSLLESFDDRSPALIDPMKTHPPVEGFPKTALVCFTQHFADLILTETDAVPFDLLKGGRTVPIYKLNYKGTELAFYHTLLGGAASAALLEEVLAKGAQKVLFFGSCGSLDQALTAGRLIVPTAAYRDEGASYHYAPASDFIEIPTADRLAGVFDAISVPYVKTKTWTTDAFYRETRDNVRSRKAMGCSTVEMECASVMAVGQFRKKEIYQFLYAADCLDGADWDRRILGNMPEDLRERIMKVALETAIRL